MASRIFATDDQWVERVTDGADPGVRYYDGVQRGFVPAHPRTRIGVATEAEMAEAMAEAKKRLRDRREWCLSRS